MRAWRAAARDAYRICLALADLKTKTIISKGVARALPEGIDPTPVAFFADSPVFAKDASTDAYIKSCQGTKVGDTVDQAYADRIVVASLVNDGIEAYDDGRYRDALDVYQSALKTPGGEQLRVLNGIYLANYKLHRTRSCDGSVRKGRRLRAEERSSRRQVPVQARLDPVLYRSEGPGAL